MFPSRTRMFGLALIFSMSFVACASDDPPEASTATDDSSEVEESESEEPSPSDAAGDEEDEAEVQEVEPADEAAGDERVVDETSGELFPDVLGVEASLDGDGTWTFSVTLSSPYDTPERYADAWRVVGPDGTEYGSRVLTHDHANEQPFTRSQSGIEIPDDVEVVTVEGRDQVSGWGGATMEIQLER